VRRMSLTQRGRGETSNAQGMALLGLSCGGLRRVDAGQSMAPRWLLPTYERGSAEPPADVRIFSAAIVPTLRHNDWSLPQAKQILSSCEFFSACSSRAPYG